MARYHINLEGNPGRCSAKVDNCPFGSEEKHFTSKAEARRHYEETAEPTITAFEVMQKRFDGNALIQSRRFAQAIDAGNEDFAKDADGMAIQRMMILASDLSSQQQKFIDKGIQQWYGERVTELLSLNKSFGITGASKESREELENKWRKLNDDITSTYRQDLEYKISRNKSVMRYLARSADNYRRFTQALDLMEVMTERSYGSPRFDLYDLKPNMNNYDKEDLVRLAAHSPIAANHFMETYGDSVPQQEKNRLYNLIADKEEEYSTGYLPRRRDAIYKVLEGSDFNADGNVEDQKNIFLDASQKLNQANGISSKDFAKIMKRKLKNFEVKSPSERAIVNEIIDNIRNSKG